MSRDDDVMLPAVDDDSCDGSAEPCG